MNFFSVSVILQVYASFNQSVVVALDGGKERIEMRCRG